MPRCTDTPIFPRTTVATIEKFKAETGPGCKTRGYAMFVTEREREREKGEREEESSPRSIVTGRLRAIFFHG